MSENANINDWLLAGSLELDSAEKIVLNLTDILCQQVQINRLSFDIHTAHSEIYVKNIIWKRDKGVESEFIEHQRVTSPIYKNSPIAAIYGGSPTIRLPLLNASEYQYPDLQKELCRQGNTDYIIFPMDYTRGGRSYVSYTTDQEGGFSTTDIKVLESMCAPLSRRLEIEFCHYSTRSLLDTYLGKSAAAQVTSGNFKRVGSGELINAVIWQCDLRGFTDMSMNSEAEELIIELDKFFESIADSISKYEGDIIKFIGDSIIVIFTNEEAEVACRNALQASNEILAKFTDGSRQIAIVIHYGSVIFGNVGSRDRMDFTIIGKDVNFTSRLEGVCKQLNLNMVLSENFIQVSRDKNFAPLGKYNLKGFPNPEALYTLDKKV
ncbi:MAG: adenylate/guanylate cyclase domain-containing protein [Pseudomonadota bacterium]|nr:adenylate/guanylate cyclase domain-containing protein [Pseudomonadota bacterium]